MHKPNKTGPITQQHHKTNIKTRYTKNIKPTSFKFIGKQTFEYIINIDFIWDGKLRGIFLQVEPYVIRSNVLT